MGGHSDRADRLAARNLAAVAAGIERVGGALAATKAGGFVVTYGRRVLHFTDSAALSVFAATLPRRKPRRTPSITTKDHA